MFEYLLTDFNVTEDQSNCGTDWTKAALQHVFEELLLHSANKLECLETWCPIPDHVESKAGELASPAEGVEPGAENCEAFIAAATTTFITFICTFPRTVWRMCSLWLTEYILELHLGNEHEKNLLLTPDKTKT